MTKHTFLRLTTSIFFTIFLCVSALTLPTQVSAQTRSLNSNVEGTPKELIVGDRVNITVTAKSWEGVLATGDHKYKLKIFNPKPGQECTTTDDVLKDDGTIKGYCEAKGDPGNMEIGVESDDYGTFQLNGQTYSKSISGRYNAMFNDPKTTCSGGQAAPSAVVIQKQNDITVKVEWQQSDSFVGTYDVLYGNEPGEYPKKHRATIKSTIIDGIDPNKTYYFKVNANSACKWMASSKVFMYLPKTGSVSEATVKPNASASPKATPKATVRPVSPSPKVTAQPAAIPDASPVPDAIATPIMKQQPLVVSPQPKVAPSFLQRVGQTVAGFFRRLKFW